MQIVKNEISDSNPITQLLKHLVIAENWLIFNSKNSFSQLGNVGSNCKETEFK